MADNALAIGHRARLRERFQKGGFSGFAPHEVLELLLTLAIPRKDVKTPAKLLIARFGSLKNVLEAPAEEVRAVSGMGSVAPIALAIIREAAGLYVQESAEASRELGDLRRLLQIRLGGLGREVFEVAFIGPGEECRMAKFIDDDDGYLQWAEQHPMGFVLNCERKPRAAYLILHRSTCLHITQAGPQATRWTADYIKVCSEDKESLNTWADVETGGNPTLCQTCEP